MSLPKPMNDRRELARSMRNPREDTPARAALIDAIGRAYLVALIEEGEFHGHPTAGRAAETAYQTERHRQKYARAAGEPIAPPHLGAMDAAIADAVLGLVAKEIRRIERRRGANKGNEAMLARRQDVLEEAVDLLTAARDGASRGEAS